jgi:hypothetical protein
MVEEREVAYLHLIAHEVARLIVAHAEPGGRLLLRRGEVVDRELVGLRLHQPVTQEISAFIRGYPPVKVSQLG